MTHPQTQDDEALVEAMARAMVEIFCSRNNLKKQSIWRDYHADYLAEARAALTALRNHEGRK